MRAPIIKQVFSTSCLGIEIDCRVKWDIHVTGLITSFSQKLNLLKSFYFLPTQARLDFYYKVTLPAICGIIVWGSVSKTLFESLERIHVRAAKLIYGLNWDMPTTQVLATSSWRSLKHTYLSKMLCLVYICYYTTSGPIHLVPQNL